MKDYNKKISDWLLSIFSEKKIRTDIFKLNKNDFLKHHKDDLYYITASYEIKPETKIFLISNSIKITPFSFEINIKNNQMFFEIQVGLGEFNSDVEYVSFKVEICVVILTYNANFECLNFRTIIYDLNTLN